MTDQFIPDQSDESDVKINDSPGCQLRGARQARGLSVEQAAAQLRLSKDVIRALERDEYGTLRGNVFVIGYIRNYARLVMLDPEPLLDTYRATMPEEKPSLQPPRRQARHTLRTSRPRRGRGGPLFLGGLVVAGALALLWWYQQYGEVLTPLFETAPDYVAATPATQVAAGNNSGKADTTAIEEEAEASAMQTPPAPAPAPAPPATSTPAPEAPEAGSESIPVQADESPAAPTQVQATDPVSEEIPAVVAPDTAGQPPPNPVDTTSPVAQAEPDTPPAAATGQREIVLTFSGPCWVDVRDSERSFKLFGEMREGDRQVLEGTPPYSLILGNAAAVSVTIDGAPFDLAAISSGNVARFTLDPAQLP